MDAAKREDLERQIRKHEGQSEWTRWAMRVERLGELGEMMEAWNEREEVLAMCPTAPDALKALRQMHADAAKKLEALSEFAPEKKSRKKK